MSVIFIFFFGLLWSLGFFYVCWDLALWGRERESKSRIDWIASVQWVKLFLKHSQAWRIGYFIISQKWMSGSAQGIQISWLRPVVLYICVNSVVVVTMLDFHLTNHNLSDYKNKPYMDCVKNWFFDIIKLTLPWILLKCGAFRQQFSRLCVSQSFLVLMLQYLDYSTDNSFC